MARFSSTIRWLGPAFAALGLVLLILLVLHFPGEQSLAQEPVKRAHVVVQFSDGRTAVRPITWTGEISRIAALQRAGFSVEYDPSWEVVCNIDGDGCPASDCFCAANWWAQGQWVSGCGGRWDQKTWPPPLVQDGDVIAFRNSTDWGLDGKLPAAPVYVAASRALEWMRTQQQSDGSYADAFGKIGASVRALIAVASAGYDPAGWGNPSLYHFLTVISPTETLKYAATSAAGAGKLTLGVAWARKPVTDFIGANLVLSITTFYSPTTGQYGWGSGDTAWAVLGLHAAGQSIPIKTVDFLKSVQKPDGGWSWNEWGPNSEVQHTALVVQALLAAGEPVSSTSVISAMNFIRSARNADGGYGYTPGQSSDVDT
ncbi:MAG: terpene cyclase/mutase family protein, partial [Anaerolineae bacterium]|nr:terpene cyclase/mutase family protein [Anaerolineae bacterium]